MAQTVEYTSWPLPEELTRKIVGYLNAYRMIVAILLGVAHIGGLMPLSGDPMLSPAAAGVILLGYLLFAVLHLFSARRPGANSHRLATYSLFTDVAFLSLLVLVYGAVAGGVGILLVFTSAVAAVLLPLQMALLIASIASLSMIGAALWRYAAAGGAADALIVAGLFGVTAMVSALLTHRLAYWARDLRLVAERRGATLSELQQVNELIIRRMRVGVLAVDETGLIRVMNESAWFLLGRPSVRHGALRSLSPRLEQAVAYWREHPGVEPRPVVLEPSQAPVLPDFVNLPGEGGLGALIFLNDNNVVARRAVELSVNSLAKLAGSIAHEIRNPLAALSHASQLLEESPKISPTDTRLIHIIRNHARRMNGIVENILQLSRREHSRPELVPLHAYLPEFANEFQTSQLNQALDFQLAIPTDDTFVLFDRSQLDQCLWKLLDNAVDHAGRDRSSAKVRLALTRDEEAGFCVITVSDNGPGIGSTQISKIFEPFYTTRNEGSGLGLYIARQLCEANQAELTVDSEPGEGAFFHIRLALARVTSATAADPQAVGLG